MAGGGHIDPLVLWRDAVKLGRQEGYVCYVDVSRTVEAEPGTIVLNGYAVDDRFMGIQGEADDDGLIFRPEGDPKTRCRTFAFALDVSSGQARAVANDGQEASASEPLLEGFQDAVGRHGLLDLFRGLENVVRVDRSGKEAYRHDDWSWWEPGMPVSWKDVVPGDPDDTYEIDGTTVVADELFCATVDCGCRTVDIVFHEQAGDRENTGEDADEEEHEHDLVGFVTLEHPRYRVTKTKAEQGRRRQLDTAWAAYRERHGDLAEHLEPRREHVRSLDHEIADLAGYDTTPEAPARSTKVGPNEPCPCGSGKKHKLCCG